MDERIRSLERRARAGDPEAALAWMREAERMGDRVAEFTALMLYMDLSTTPELRRIMEMVDEIDRLRPPFGFDHGIRCVA